MDGVLAHHGIKGQKWGVRRYQNADGTLTAEGRERYGLSGLLDQTPKAAPVNAKSGSAELLYLLGKTAATAIVSTVARSYTQKALKVISQHMDDVKWRTYSEKGEKGT